MERSRAARILAAAATVAACIAVWPAAGILRANPGGMDSRLLWVLIPILASVGVLMAVRRPTWMPVWMLTGTSWGFVILAAWSVGLYFAPSALLLLFAGFIHLASTRPTWRALLIPAWFIAGATTVCVLFVLRDLALSPDVIIAEAPAVSIGARISVGVWVFLAFVTLLGWLRGRNQGQ
jgi:hypothetical protein